MTATCGIASSSGGWRICRRLLVPRDILSFEEVLNPADIEPHAVVFEYVHRCFLLQHLEHQIVEAKWNARRDTFKYRGIHAVNAHADEMRQFRLLAKSGHTSVGLVDHAKVHLGGAGGGGDSERSVMSSMTAHELVEVKIGKYVTVKNQERLVE